LLKISARMDDAVIGVIFIGATRGTIAEVFLLFPIIGSASGFHGAGSRILSCRMDLGRLVGSVRVTARPSTSFV
jgi:hypothetical protein